MSSNDVSGIFRPLRNGLAVVIRMFVYNDQESMRYRRTINALLRTVHGWLLMSLAVLVLFPAEGQAQELDCQVSVDYSSLGGSDFDHLTDLEGRIEEYLNEHQWTDDRFQPHERINCSLDLAFMEAQGLDNFTVRTVIVSRRPIYGTAQATTVFQHMDRQWQFTYVENQSIIHDLNQFDPIASFLDFYAYVILGFDYDTFSERGGTSYFEQARRVAELAQSGSGSGWSSSGSARSREALIEDILDPTMQPLRNAYFQYHFEGLDYFTVETESARESILQTLQTIRELTNQGSDNYYVDLFFSSKYEELAAIFQDGDQRMQAVQILLETDPSHSNTYNSLLQ